MDNHDLRSYLKELEDKNQLLRISEEVDTLDEMGALDSVRNITFLAKNID